MKEWNLVNKMHIPIPVLSPISGIVLNRNVEFGQNIELDDVLFILGDNMILKANIMYKDIDKIKIDQTVKYYFNPEVNDKKPGTVKNIAQNGILVNNYMYYEITIIPNQQLDNRYIHQQIQIEIPVGIKSNVSYIPRQAVKNIDYQPFVVFNRNNKLILKRIQTGITDGKNIEIIKGIHDYDKVLLLNDVEFKKFVDSQLDWRQTKVLVPFIILLALLILLVDLIFIKKEGKQ